ncbi:pentapeptide repeat-containing protein [Streptomyces uncialis]|uniref:pentapeptide repeat-containing protein n=1 Tax=Streptomyces uncialis TaxID=1048205 RepID=UPI0036509D3D
MPRPSPEPSRTPPAWPHCGHGTTPQDPVGCRGIHVPGHTACLAHTSGADFGAYLACLAPGADIDHRGTRLTEALLGALLSALRDPVTGRPRLGEARFGSAVVEGGASFGSVDFEGDASFGSAVFEGIAWFESAVFKANVSFGSATFRSTARFNFAAFEGDTRFVSTTFEGDARFGAAVFKGVAWFQSTTFEGDVSFGSAIIRGEASFVAASFTGVAWFASTTFCRDAWFGSAAFGGDVRFTATAFGGDARFWQAVFDRSVTLGPFVCAGQADFSGVVFSAPVTLWLAARRLVCRRTRWLSTADLRLRYATVNFAHAVFEYPLTIAAEADPFVGISGQPVAEQAFAAAADATVRMDSLRGVDAAHLVLADVDLSGCLLTGTVHLDQLRLEGACSFDTVPPRTHWTRWHPVRFTHRRALAEEHHWRAKRPTAVRGWNVAVLGAGHAGPAQLAPVYRALRKAFEDGKDGPGAADFYYGEMEMRRHDRTGASRAERGLLHGYWMLSGYGLRASRALGWLAGAMLVTLVLLMGFGLPQDSPKQEVTGLVPPGGGKVTLEIGKADPRNPTGDRFTGERFEKALNVTLTSVVFKASGQDLTTTGTYIEMASRVTEPVLLGLAVLAVRNRIKR